jgi:predicted lipoprotein with Yx(FWY)xxD motif
MRHRMLAASAVLGTLLLGILLAGCGTSSAPGSAYNAAAAPSSPMTSPTARSSASGTTAVLTVRKTRLGYVLATSGGYTIYWYSRDHRGSSRSACTGSCLMAWPPVTGMPVAAKGLKLDAVLGFITRPGGMVQATYNGYPLYTFASDTAPGQIKGAGEAGVWHVIREKAPARSASTGSSTTGSSTGGSSSGGSSTGGYGY